MEERLMDDPRKIKVKRNAEGGIVDATDALAPEGEEGAEEEEIELKLPEGELDEDLVGLAPSQLEKELERRKKEAEEAAAERDRLLSEGEALLRQKKYEEAEPLFSQALVYDPESDWAQEAVWICRTRDFTDTEPLYDREWAEEFREAGPAAKKLLREKLGAALQAEKSELEEEATPLHEKVYRARNERRGAFVANRNYYRGRLLIFGAIFCIFVVAMSIFGSFIVHVRGNIPLILTIVFGGLALLDLIPILFFSRKFIVAQRLVSDNEKLSSTEEGERLEELETALETLSFYLED